MNLKMDRRAQVVIIAEETLAAFERGYYTNADGARVDVAAPLTACLDATREYDPDELARLRDQVLARQESAATTFAITPETTLEGSARLVASGRYQRIGVLNFASARHPGGGFLTGALAQEESLARSSGLYLSLLKCPEYYVFHRAQDTSLYSDRMIYSPACPVIRDDEGHWLPGPFAVDFITSAAPNAGAVMRNEPRNRARIAPTLAERASKVLALAAHRECDALALGAWGCGAFGNDPVMVARVFYDLLRPDGAYGRSFRHVLFAIFTTKREQANYNAFTKQFASLL
jgi:uncharacterized protein (TIGR02452 family)